LEFAATAVKKEFSMKTIQRQFFNFTVPAMAEVVMLAGLAACSRQNRSASGGSPGSVQVQTASVRTAPERDFAVTLNSTEDGCVITKYTGPGGRIIIPAKIQGLPVREIGVNAFVISSLTSVAIPDGVTVIGDSAFFGASLASVTIPDSVTVIGNGAFYGCVSLASVTIPDGVTVIGNSAFSSTDLKSVTIPDSVTEIGNSAFSVCSSLTSVAVPDSVTVIGDWAFSTCSSLEQVTISLVAEREWIGSDQFKDCKLSLAAQKALRDKGYTGNF
jgi:hypothetical protein